MSTTHTPPTDQAHARTSAVAAESIVLMASGSVDDFVRVVHPEAVNHEAAHEPPSCRVAGPIGFHATALWLRAAFADLQFDVDDVVVEGDLVAIHNTMSGRQIGPMTFFVQDGSVGDVFPSRGRRFAITQSHWVRVRDGQVIEHWANRDDLGIAKQLGWVPPTPRYLLRMKRARRRIST